MRRSSFTFKRRSQYLGTKETSSTSTPFSNRTRKKGSAFFSKRIKEDLSVTSEHMVCWDEGGGDVTFKIPYDEMHV